MAFSVSRAVDRVGQTMLRTPAVGPALRAAKRRLEAYDAPKLGEALSSFLLRELIDERARHLARLSQSELTAVTPLVAAQYVDRMTAELATVAAAIDEMGPMAALPLATTVASLHVPALADEHFRSTASFLGLLRRTRTDLT